MDVKQKVHFQALRVKFETIHMKDFKLFLRVLDIVNQLKNIFKSIGHFKSIKRYGDILNDAWVVEKILQTLASKFGHCGN